MSGREPGPEVSVIIPCLNSTRTLGLQLEALASQVDPPRFEVIIADNGSTDGLRAFLQLWEGNLRLRYAFAGDTRGAAFARNVGSAMARAPKLLFCDSDDVVASDWVRCGAELLERFELFSGPGLQIADCDLPSTLKRAWEYLDEQMPPGKEPEAGIERAWPIIVCGNFGIRKSTFYSLGGFDASLVAGVEDNDLAVRVQQSGRTIAAAPGARILYRQHSNGGAAFRTMRLAGLWHMILCARHGLWAASPHLNHGHWQRDSIRIMGSAARMALSPRTSDWGALLRRTGLLVGMWQGWWRTRSGGIGPDPEIGKGLVQTETAHGCGCPRGPTESQ